jgi:hypothetical protein
MKGGAIALRLALLSEVCNRPLSPPQASIISLTRLAPVNIPRGPLSTVPLAGAAKVVVARAASTAVVLV